MSYKLSAALYGHSMDVRALAVTPDGRIISTSRDKTAKVWKPNPTNSAFTEVQKLEGHSNFVSSVCVLPASEEFPGGLILTGSNDSTICAYHLDSPNPAAVFVLRGHSNTVCCLSPSNDQQTPWVALSASWDGTAKVWSIPKRQPLLTLTGHQAAVWAVLQLASGRIVTASADKTVRSYRTTDDGQALADQILTGHTDCVRALAAFSDPAEFLSCANDATIRKWNVISGECLDIWYGHPNYIYSICGSASGLVVSGGEDRAVHVWTAGGGKGSEGGKGGGQQQQQAISIPAQSVWAVAILPNQDIVTGSSDGVVRVFSADQGRQADETGLARFAEEVADLNKSAEQEIGGVKVSDLPGKEALFESGRSDGQTKLIREGTAVSCYSWSDATHQWTRVGDVLGAGGGGGGGAGAAAAAATTTTTAGKTLYNGKEYDYVFSVDIEDGQPPLKLPYNDGDDPWHAAQAFIHSHDLSQQFLEQVANFIVVNSSRRPPIAMAPAPAPGSHHTEHTAQQQFCDPFTGGARYIPTGETHIQQQLRNGDSLTETSSSTSNEAALFPQTSYLRFDTGNLKLILEKLEEFNKKSCPSSVTSEQLESVVKLADVSAQPSESALRTLQELLNWSDELLFPVLDVLRLGLRNMRVNSVLCAEGPVRAVTLDVLRRQMGASRLPANQMLAVRGLSNMLLHPAGEAAVRSHGDALLADLDSLIATATIMSKQLQIALATALLNLSILFIKDEDSPPSRERVLRLLEKAVACGSWCTDPEAQLRALVAVGTLLSASESAEEEIKGQGAGGVHQQLSPAFVETVSALADRRATATGTEQASKVAVCSSQILSRFLSRA